MRRLLCFLAALTPVTAAATALTWAGAGAGPPAGAGGGPAPALPDRTVVHAFPSKNFDPAAMPNPGNVFDPANYPAAVDTVWVIEWDLTNPSAGSPPSNVLRVRAAHFMCRRAGGAPRWVTVARDLAVGEVFVPYDPGTPQYEDVQGFNFDLQPGSPALLGPPCLAKGEILSAADPLQAGKVYKEVRDDGVRWLDDDGRGAADRGRRGEKLVLWANFYAANYRYVLEYAFADDGTVACRVGGTARNYWPRQPAGQDTHLHVGCWAFDPDLGDPTDPANGGPDKNDVRLVRRVQRTPGTADGRFRLDAAPFPGAGQAAAVSGSAVWVADQFTALRVESTVRKNTSGLPQPLGYDLVPVRAGSARNFPAAYEYANKDFWVTVADPSFTQFSQVPAYVGPAGPVPLTGRAVRVWHNSPVLHAVRAEDFGPDGVSNAAPPYGVATTAWAGFTLKPRNVFDSTPLFTP